MPATKGGSRALLRTLRTVMAGAGDGQQRLDKIVSLVASNMVAEVCSIYLKRDEHTLELCATQGLRPDSVHSARLRVGQGLVGRIAERAEPLATDDAPNEPGFRYLPETGEERYRSFVGVPIQRLGEVMGVLVVQNEAARTYEEDDIEALETVAMVIAEMAESGAFLGSGGVAAGPGRRRGPVRIQGSAASEGTAVGPVHLHEPRMVVFRPIAEDTGTERQRLAEAMAALRGDADRLTERSADSRSGEEQDIFEAYRMVAYDKGWARRLHEAIESGLSAEVAVEKVQSDIRSRMERVGDPYLRERLHDLDDIANRLLRYLVQPRDGRPEEIPQGAVLVARNLGPGALMDHARAHLGRRARGGLALLALRHRRPCARHSDDRPGRPDHARRQSRRRDRRRRRDRARPPAPGPGHPRALPRQDRPCGAGAGGASRARRPPGDHALRGDDHAEDERRHTRRPALARAVGRRGRRALSHRTPVHDPRPDARPDRAGRALRPGHGGGRRRRDHLPHARHRLGQGAALYAADARAEPGARLAGDPRRARPAVPLPHADPGADPGGGRATVVDHVPDDRRGGRVLRGPGHGRGRDGAPRSVTAIPCPAR